MAFNPDAVWSVSFSFWDNNGNTAGTSVAYPGTRTYTEVSDDALALAALLQAVSDARLRSIYIMRQLRNDDTSPIAATSEVERKLSITMGSTAYPNSTRMEVPSPIFAMEQPRTDAPDPTNAAWVALQAGLVGTALDPGGALTDYRGEPLTEVSRAAFVHRNRKPRV